MDATTILEEPESRAQTMLLRQPFPSISIMSHTFWIVTGVLGAAIIGMIMHLWNVNVFNDEGEASHSSEDADEGIEADDDDDGVIKQDPDSQGEDDDEDDMNSPNGTPGQVNKNGLSRRQRKNRKQVASNIRLNNGKREQQKSKVPFPAFTRLGLDDDSLYRRLLNYVHDRDVLLRHSFPLESKSSNGGAQIYQDVNKAGLGVSEADSEETEVKLNPNAEVFQPGVGYNVTNTPPSNRRRPLGVLNPEQSSKLRKALEMKIADVAAKECLRCHATFYIDSEGRYQEQEECKFHWYKHKNFKFACCNRSVKENPCERAPYHVWKGIRRWDRLTYIKDHVITKKPKKDVSCGNRVYALDAEMAFTAFGFELVRISVVGHDGLLVYEAYVMPQNEIVDYNTRFSGVDARCLKQKANKTLKEVQNDIMGFVNADTILVGHGLENDLRVLKLVHYKIIDTAILFLKASGKKSSLKNLAAQYLGKQIQTESQLGHDSIEDARTCMELVLWKLSSDMKGDKATNEP